MNSLYSKTAMEIFHNKAVSLSICFVREKFPLHRARLCDSLIFESLLSFVMSRASFVLLACSSLLSSLLALLSTYRIPSFCITSIHACFQNMSPLWANAFHVLDWYKLLQLGLLAVRRIVFVSVGVPARGRGAPE